MNAEEFYNEQDLENNELYFFDNGCNELAIWNKEEMIIFAEAYLKAKVNSITDELTKNSFIYMDGEMTEPKGVIFLENVKEILKTTTKTIIS